jgi:two-component system phosphate regulon sensor histidine kinase PhoR
MGTACCLIGIINGYLAWTLTAGGVIYLLWTLLQLRRLDIWLSENHQRPPPEASGIWGDIFDRIYHLQQQQKKEKRHLQKLVNRVQEATAALRDGVILIDRHGNMEWWNRSAQKLLGFQPNDQGQAIVNFIRQPRFVHYFENGKYIEPLDMVSPRGRAQRLQFQINRYGSKERLVVVRNITRLHRLESIRRDFIANVSHEMRTPLTVVKGYLETLEDSGELPDKWLGAIRQMQAQSQRMSLLINDLITLSKLETEEPDHNQKPFSLRPLLQSVLAETQTFSADQKHTIQLHGDEEIQMLGSEKELHSAFTNLSFNAVKYTPAGGNITLSLSRDEKGLFFSVKDSGIGIEAKHIPRLTERFYRVDQSRHSETGGTGLGLAIVKHILRRHDGRLNIQSEPGQGSSFGCRFPLSRIINTNPEES